MGIHKANTPIHWNYFLSIESDVLNLSRYIEFTEENNDSYSIEQARILLSTSAEVDVVAKSLCKRINPEAPASNIIQYQNALAGKLGDFGIPEIHEIQVTIPRFGLRFHPWERWSQENTPPKWWRAHTDVKHERNINFNQANLKNTLNSVAGLFVLLIVYYRFLANDGEYQGNAGLFAPPKLFQDGIIFYGRTHG